MAESKKRGTCWLMTINNPTPQDDEDIAKSLQRGWGVKGQVEKGEENGVVHYQFMLKTPQVRGSAIHKAFPRAHYELARSEIAVSNYVSKDKTRIGELPLSQAAYPSMSQVWKWFGEMFESRLGIPYESEASCKCTGEDMLKVWDAMIASKIEQGYYVEIIGVNPQNRSCVKNYGLSIAHREINQVQPPETKDRQTDRQDASEELRINLPTDSITEDGEDEIDGESVSGGSGTEDGTSSEDSEVQEDEEDSEDGEGCGSDCESSAGSEV